MNCSANVLNRREFVSQALLATSIAAVSGLPVSAEAHALSDYQLCAFEKFLQELSYEELADTIADLGFHGIEATVREGGHVAPERVEEELPRMVRALNDRGLEVTIMTTDVLNADHPLSEKVLRTGVEQGIDRYRMGFYRYDKNRPVLKQLEEIRPGIEKLAERNRELGITALYQNHSDVSFVGATIWDLYLLLRDIPTEEISCAFDVRHATIEAGLSWPVLYDVIKPHIGAIYVKDFQWQGEKAEHVPLGTGRVDPRFFDMLKKDKYRGPVSLHVEYLKQGTTQQNIEALRRDLNVLEEWLG